jgi:hypothetical protein
VPEFSNAQPTPRTDFEQLVASCAGVEYSLRLQVVLADLLIVPPFGKSMKTLPTGLAFIVPRVEPGSRVERYESKWTYPAFAGAFTSVLVGGYVFPVTCC